MLHYLYYGRPDLVAPLLDKEEGKLDSVGLHWNCEAYVLEEQHVPADTIPIGSDPGNNQILLGISGENRGKVFYWLMHEDNGSRDEDDEFVPPTYANVAFIANSFNEFLESLHECDFGKSA